MLWIIDPIADEQMSELEGGYNFNAMSAAVCCCIYALVYEPNVVNKKSKYDKGDVDAFYDEFRGWMSCDEKFEKFDRLWRKETYAVEKECKGTINEVLKQLRKKDEYKALTNKKKKKPRKHVKKKRE